MTEAQLKSFFKDLGLSTEETQIYLALVRKGSLTTLQLARTTDINRTQTYRFLEKMKAKGLVEEMIDEHRLMAKAVDTDYLERLIHDQEAKVKSLKTDFADIKKFLLGQANVFQPGTKVKFYRGQKGIQQMVWNDLKANGEIVGFTYLTFVSAVGEKYALSFFEEMIKRKIKLRDIYCDNYLESLKDGERESVRYRRLLPRYDTFIESRYIPSKILNIEHQIDIYNDVVAYYNWYEGEIFGVEICNQKIASMQKQLFEMVWQQAEPEGKVKRKMI